MQHSIMSRRRNCPKSTTQINADLCIDMLLKHTTKQVIDIIFVCI